MMECCRRASRCATDRAASPASVALAFRGVQHGFEACFDAGPLGIDNAEINGMPDASAGRNHVVPEYTLFEGPDAQDRRARAVVQRIRLQLHAHAAQRFES